jgi:hypothetical protein
MERNRDKEIINAWLDCYNRINSTDFRVVSYPDEEERHAESIDALCEDSNKNTLGLEHTKVEAFPGEMEDNARFLAVVGQFENDPNFIEAGFQTSASIPVFSIPNGVNWRVLARDVGTFLKDVVRRGGGIYGFVQGPVSIPITVSKLNIPGSRGSFLVERNWPGSNELTIEKSLTTKLPKLRKSSSDRKVLLLEQQAIAGSVSADLANNFDEHGYPDWLPDEIWLLRTPGFGSERYLHASQQYPAMNSIKVNWKDGKVTL